MMERLTSIQDISKSGIKVFPNPSKGAFFIDSEQGEKINEVKVYDLLGKLVYEATELNISNHKVILGEAIPGLYLIEIRTDSILYSSKIVIQ